MFSMTKKTIENTFSNPNPTVRLLNKGFFFNQFLSYNHWRHWKDGDLRTYKNISINIIDLIFIELPPVGEMHHCDHFRFD